MSRFIALIAFIGITILGFSKGEELVLIVPIHLQSSELDTSISTSKSIYHFDFAQVLNIGSPISMTYTVDGVKHSETFSSNPELDILIEPGEHTFTFFLNDSYSTITSQPLVIKPQHKDSYRVTFQQIKYEPGDIQVVTCKPVIYLYPETKTEVSVKLDFEGEHPFLYPEYNDGWKCAANPNGDLEIDGDSYNYLFWEAHQPDHLSTTDLKTGFVVEGKNAISFLKEKLTLAGLNSEEQADFITFWGPLLMKNTSNFVRFEFNDACDKFTELNISPQPDNVYRIYIFFSPIDGPMKTVDQDIPRMNRDGFTVIEWGGQVSKPLSTPLLNI